MDTAFREVIREDYGKAAVDGVALCSTDAYRGMSLDWIPKPILEHNQGCTSPFSGLDVGLLPGQTVVDLGCGAGLDAFLAAKLVGPRGRVYGIDMTPEMLAIGRAHAGEVARRLNYPESNVEFLQSYIEQLPLADASVDVVLSNCVINLSDDKDKLFEEIARVLRPGGRMVISDVFAMQSVPAYIKYDRVLVSQCIGGAMEIPALQRSVRRAGLVGLRHTHSGSYARIDGIDFQSLSITARKPESATSQAQEYATLLGPCSVVVDEFGKAYVRGEATAVSAQVASVLRRAPYRDYFYVSATRRELSPQSCSGVMPAPGACVYAGAFATLVGPFTSVQDDDGHTFTSGAPLEICQKTADVLAHPLYARLFSIVNRAGTRQTQAEVANCGPTCC